MHNKDDKPKIQAVNQPPLQGRLVRAGQQCIRNYHIFISDILKMSSNKFYFQKRQNMLPQVKRKKII